MNAAGRTAAFRTDASSEIGTGHVIRCLTLAQALRQEGYDCHFLCRALPGHLGGLIGSRGFECHLLPIAESAEDDKRTAHSRWLSVTQDRDAEESRPILDRLRPTWLIADHYGLDQTWEAAATPPNARRLVIDDLADRPHVCDVLLDQGLGRAESDYDGLVPGACRRLIGPRYAMLRSDFLALRSESLDRRRDGDLGHVLVFMGGTDQDNATSAVLDVLAAAGLPPNCRVTVVMGATAAWTETVLAQAARMPMPTEVRTDVSDMAALMAAADLAIGAPGGASWERCCLGVPALVVALADNQIANGEALSRAGAVRYLGRISDNLPARLTAALTEVARSETRLEMSAAAADLVDGQGVNRLCAVLGRHDYRVRPATMADAEAIYHWRYSGSSAAHYQNTEVPSLDRHLTWFRAALEDPDRRLLVISKGNAALGHVRIDRDGARPERVSICLAPEARGSGQARFVLQAGLDHAADRGATGFVADIHPDNVVSQRLFARVGFRKAGSGGGFLTFRLSVEDMIDTIG